jgi:hypothetical protein
MNLDLFPLGWVHLVASLAALTVGVPRAIYAGSSLPRGTQSSVPSPCQR